MARLFDYLYKGVFLDTCFTDLDQQKPLDLINMLDLPDVAA